MRTFLIPMCIMLSLLVNANPTPPPQVYINELKVNAANDWVIELRMYYMPGNHIDSLRVQSNSGSGTYYGNYCPNILYPNMLNTPLGIDPQGDVVAVTVYNSYYITISTGVRFGNVADPWLFSPLPNETIARTYDGFTWDCSYVMSLDDSPSIGTSNDTAGMCCSMKGKVYDMFGNPVCNHMLSLDYPFVTGPAGEYSTRIFSRIYTWTRIYYFNGWWYRYRDISPISYALRPDSMITRDIHLLDTIVEGISLQEKTKTVMKIFPNPVHDRLNIYLDYDLSKPVFDFSITILDLSGRIITKVKVTSAIGVTSIPIDIVSGTYVARLDGDAKMIETRRFVVQ
jgi:hypothetical protein